MMEAKTVEFQITVKLKDCDTGKQISMIDLPEDAWEDLVDQFSSNNLTGELNYEEDHDYEGIAGDEKHDRIREDN